MALEAPDPGGRRRAVVASLTIAVATVLVYSNTFDSSFHFDDVPNIVENLGLRHLSSQWPPSGNRWLGYLSFALNYRLGGLGVFGYHLANVAIHVCNGLLVFWLTALTLRTPAMRRAEVGRIVRRYLPLTAGLLFAVHPVQTQAVTYIVQRFASLATLFFLLSLALYGQARLSLEEVRPSKARSAVLYCLSVAAAAAAMKTKEISFTLPLVAALYELTFFGQRRRLLLLAPLAATALLIPYGLVTQERSLADVLGDASHVAAETPEIPRFTYLVTQSRVVVTYLRLLLLPIRQNLDYDFRLSSSLADPAVLVAIAILLAVATAAVLLLARARRTNRGAGVLVVFGVAWFFVTLSVESSLIPIRDVIFEHRMYLPSVGALLALSTALLWALERLHSSISPAVQVACALAITAGPLGVAAHERNLVWKNELTLWSDVVAKSPGKPRAHNNLGNAYEARGQLDDALLEYREAIQLDLGFAEAHNNLGKAYVAKGQVDDAVREYHDAIRLNPVLVEPHLGLGDAYKARGQLDDAVREYHDAMRLDPGRATTHNSLGNAYQARGQLDDALREYREAIRLDLGLAEAHNNLGNAYKARKQLDQAVHEFREAIRLEPGLAEAHSNLGETLAKQGRGLEAVEACRRAVELKPTPEVVFNLAVALESAGRRQEAIDRYNEFLDAAANKYPDRARKVRIRIGELRASLLSNSR